jgi:hypothetical protein
MPLGERLLRAVERWLQPWYSREDAERQLKEVDAKLRAEEAKGAHTEVIRQDAIAARIDAEKIRRDYQLAGSRLKR